MIVAVSLRPWEEILLLHPLIELLSWFLVRKDQNKGKDGIIALFGK